MHSVFGGERNIGQWFRITRYSSWLRGVVQDGYERERKGRTVMGQSKS